MAGKKAKGNWLAVVLIVIGFIVYKAVVETGSTVSQQTSQVPKVASSPKVRVDTYGSNGIRSDWPNMADPVASNEQNKLAKNYYVILDDSGSMKSGICASGHDSRLGAAVEALAAFAEGLPPQANIGVMSFNAGRFSELLPLGKRNSQEIRDLSRRLVASGNTPLATAISRGYDALRRQAAAQVGYGEYHLVVITDGEASEGEYPDAIIDRIVGESPVDIHTIGFCIGRDHALNQPNFLSYQSADNVEALRRGLQDVLAEAPAFTVTRFE
jgi:Ca-activated chloride channel homolog